MKILFKASYERKRMYNSFSICVTSSDQARGVHGSSYVHARHARTHVRTWKGRKLKKSNIKWHIINKMKKANNKKIVSVKMTLFL